jgi:phospholipase/carboxylesterase
MSLDTYIHFEKPGDAGAPLVFTFHGTGGDEYQFPGLVEQILPRASIVSPRGDVSERGANRFFRRTGEGIYDMDDLAERTDTMTAFMRAHIARRPDTPVYALGYSNGANILASVLFKVPELVSRAALLHPLVPWAPAPNPRLKGRSILVSAGMTDPICPWPQTETLLQFFEREQAALDVVTHPGGHEIRQEELMRLHDFLTKETSRAA